jgi:hypothetical protein
VQEPLDRWIQCGAIAARNLNTVRGNSR